MFATKNNYIKTLSANKMQNSYGIYPKQKASINFLGQYYGSEYYYDSEIAYAKEYSNQGDWEEKYREVRLKKLMEKFDRNLEKITGISEDSELTIRGYLTTMFFFISIPAMAGAAAIEEAKQNKKIDAEIARIKQIMVHLNIEKIKEQEKEKARLAQEEKILSRKNAIQEQLYKNFINPLQNFSNDPNFQVPTAILIYGSTKSERNYALDWLKNNTSSRIITFDLPENEDDAMYRVQTEIEYAQNYYKNNNRRTVFFINDFDRLLREDHTSAQTIGDMKELMSSLSMDNVPVSLIFQTNDLKKINKAFLSNNIRIPYKLNLDNIDNA